MEKDEEGKMIIMKFHSWVATHNTAHSIPLAVCLVSLLHFFKHSRKTKDVEQKNSSNKRQQQQQEQSQREKRNIEQTQGNERGER